jgi:hypothetical protein
MSIALSLKWIWKIYQDADGLWAELLRANYLGDSDLFSPAVPMRGSQLWNSIQKLKWYFKLGVKHHVCDGRRTYFWLDWWTGTRPLHLIFPRLFDCCDNPFATMAGVRDAEGWHVRSRRTFGLVEVVEWDNLCRIFDLHPFNPGNDKVTWGLENSVEFTTKSMYYRLSLGGAVTHFSDIWKIKVPQKIKIFLWQLLWGRLSAGDQLVNRRGPSDGF